MEKKNDFIRISCRNMYSHFYMHALILLVSIDLEKFKNEKVGFLKKISNFHHNYFYYAPLNFLAPLPSYVPFDFKRDYYKRDSA